jgi:hypothetical protein
MKQVFIIVLTCLVVTGCGPSDAPKGDKEFMKTLGQCKECGKRKINLFGGEK